MIKELHLHYLPNLLKKSEQEFTNELVNIYKKYDVKTAISALKISGICFSPYSGKNHTSLLNTCYKKLIEVDSTIKDSIDKLTLEINILEIIFNDFNKSRSASGVNLIPKELHISSFLTTIEIVIQLFNKLLLGEKIDTLKNDYPILLFFIEKEKELDIGISNNPRLHMIIDNFMEDAGEILKYFNYMGSKNIDFHTKISTQNLIANISHLVLFDRWKILLQLFNYWKYYDWGIIEKNKNEFEFSTNNINQILGQKISVYRYRALRTKWMIEYDNYKDTIKVDKNSDVLPPTNFISPP